MMDNLLNTSTAQTFTSHCVPRLKKGGLTDWQVNAVRALVLSNIEERCSLSRLAETARLSASHFCKAFHITCGMSPMSYVRHIKIAAACSLMLRDALPLSEIALKCGFADQSHFGRVFRGITGHPPKRWQRKHGYAEGMRFSSPFFSALNTQSPPPSSNLKVLATDTPTGGEKFGTSGCPPDVHRRLLPFRLGSDYPRDASSERLRTDHQAPGLKKGGLTDWQVNAVRALVLSDLEGRHSLTRLAEAAKLSVSHFGRAFRMTCGMSPMEYVRRIKVEAACSLMLRDALPLSEIALQCGFADQAHLSRVFRVIKGHPPRRWQAKYS